MFQHVQRSRNYSMSGPLPIPVNVIKDYCELFYIDSIAQRERIFRYTEILDDAYLEHANKESKKQTK